MKIAFVLFKYFPHGGLQRDFVKIAAECQARGHSVSVYAMAWTGAVPAGFDCTVLRPRGISNHRRCLDFVEQLRRQNLSERYDLVIGFNKVPGLDVYFAADPCFVALNRGRWFPSRWTARYRSYSALERAVFTQGKKTRILLLNPAEQAKFVLHYQTESSRFQLLPPGIPRRRPDPRADAALRDATRSHLGLRDEDRLLLMVGSGFHTKGVDRAIRALAALPAGLIAKSRLLVIGQGESRPLMKLAGKLGVSGRVAFAGVQDEVSPYYLAADLLVHPARSEAAGMVLIEALTHGLPVLVTEGCGYAFHVLRAEAGLAVPEPFQQRDCSALLARMLEAQELPAWKRNGLAYAERTDLYSMPQRAADFFEQIETKPHGHP